MKLLKGKTVLKIWAFSLTWWNVIYYWNRMSMSISNTFWIQQTIAKAIFLIIIFHCVNARSVTPITTELAQVYYLQLKKRQSILDTKIQTDSETWWTYNFPILIATLIKGRVNKKEVDNFFQRLELPHPPPPQAVRCLSSFVQKLSPIIVK